MISIAEQSQRSKILTYDTLMSEIDISNLRELEDLIIDCIYNQLITGKLDQLNQRFQVVTTFGRDVRDSDIDSMLQKLQEWDSQLEEAQVNIEKNVKDCNSSIMDSYDRQMQLEMELRQRKDKMLSDISDGRDNEYGGGGPSLNLGKKHSSRKEEGGGGGL